MKLARVLITMVCAGIYSVAFMQTALIGTPPPGDLPERGLLPGWTCLVFGWLQLAWYANPLLLASHVTMHLRKSWLALILSVLALAFTPATFSVTKFPIDEAPNYATVTGYGPGFYFWVASIALTVLCQAGLILLGRHPAKSPPAPPAMA